MLAGPGAQRSPGLERRLRRPDAAPLPGTHPDLAAQAVPADARTILREHCLTSRRSDKLRSRERYFPTKPRDRQDELFVNRRSRVRIPASAQKSLGKSARLATRQRSPPDLTAN